MGRHPNLKIRGIIALALIGGLAVAQASAQKSVTVSAGHPADPIGQSSSVNGFFEVHNNSALDGVEFVIIDLSTALLPDLVFDPAGDGGDNVGLPFTADVGGASVGVVGASYDEERNGGFDRMRVDFTDFNPSESFTFHADIDPNSIKGTQVPGPSDSGSISGLELTGATISVGFSDQTMHVARLRPVSGTDGAAETVVSDGAAEAPPVLHVFGHNAVDVTLGGAQTLHISGTPNSSVSLLSMEADLFTENGGFNVDVYDLNAATSVGYSVVPLDGSGEAEVGLNINAASVAGVVLVGFTSGAVSDHVSLKTQIPALLSDTLAEFDEKSARAGLAFLPGGGVTHGPGAVFTDLDDDGYPDLYAVKPGGNGLFLNVETTAGGRAFARRDDLGATAPSAGPQGASTCDYDNDGDLDLYVINFDAPNVLLKNMLVENGTISFVDVTASTDPTPLTADDQFGLATAIDAGIGLMLDRTMTASWADVNRDGLADLYVGNHNGFHANGPSPSPKWGQRDTFYLNNGDGTFTDVTETYDMGGHRDPFGNVEDVNQRYASTNATIFVDINNDDWPDLIVTNKTLASWTNDNDQLYINLGESGGVWQGFENVTYTIPGGFTDSAWSRAPMSAVVADLENDGDFDFYFSDDNSVEVPGVNEIVVNTLVENGSLGFFPDYGAPGGFSWGTLWDDLDNNGFCDIHVSGSGLPTVIDQRDFLYMNWMGNMVEIALAVGVDNPGNNRSDPTADYDRDGFLDYAVVNYFSGSIDLFQNNTENLYPERRFLSVRLEGDPSAGGQLKSTRDALGARLRLTADLDDNGSIESHESQIREILSGHNNAATTSSMEADFGMGLTTEGTLEIRWPSGKIDLFDVEANRFLEIHETLGIVSSTGTTASDRNEPASIGGTQISATADNQLSIYVNGSLILQDLGGDSAWIAAETVAAIVEVGDEIAIHATNFSGPAGMIAQLTFEDGSTLVTDSTWTVSDVFQAGWNEFGFDDSSWASATDLGGINADPWGSAGPVEGMPSGTPAKWIWASSVSTGQNAYFRRVVEDLNPPGPEPGESQTIFATADNQFSMFLNGDLILQDLGNNAAWVTAESVLALLTDGDVLAVEVTNSGGSAAGLLAHVAFPDDTSIVSSADWRVSPTAPAGWNQQGFDDSGWAAAFEIGGIDTSPWGSAGPVTGMPDGTAAQWIWTGSTATKGQKAYFRFSLGDAPPMPPPPPDPDATELVSATADNQFRLYLNGELILEDLGGGAAWKDAETVLASVNDGDLIAVEVTNVGGSAAGLLADIEVSDGSTVLTNTGWRTTFNFESLWTEPGFDDSSWSVPVDLGGINVLPWGSAGPVSGMPSNTAARWIWPTPTSTSGEVAYFRFTIGDPAPPPEPEPDPDVFATADNSFTVFVNGVAVLSDVDGGKAGWITAESGFAGLAPGDVVAVLAHNNNQAAAFIAHLAPPDQVVGTDSSWVYETSVPADWASPGFDDSGWSNAVELGPLNTDPWGSVGPVTGMPPGTPALWIWASTTSSNQDIYFRKTVPSPMAVATQGEGDFNIDGTVNMTDVLEATTSSEPMDDKFLMRWLKNYGKRD